MVSHVSYNRRTWAISKYNLRLIPAFGARQSRRSNPVPCQYTRYCVEKLSCHPKEIPGEVYKKESGSCIAVVATDAPLLPNQLKRLARRVSLGLARTGTISGNGSGDLFIAFSTANPNAANSDQVTHNVQTIPNDLMDPLFAGVVQATEEAVVNALVDNQSMIGRDNHRVEALPHDRLREILKRVHR